MSRAMLISCSRRWRSRSRSTRRALSRTFAASAARASRIWRSSLEKAAIGSGHGDGMIRQVAQRFVEGKLRMQQGTGFEQALELNQAAAGWFGAGDVLHPREQLGKGITVCTLGGTEDYFVRVVETERDGVAILKLAAIDFFSIDEEAAALAAILDIEAIGLDQHGRAVAGAAAVVTLPRV